MWSRGAAKDFHSPLAPMSTPCGPEEGKTGWEHTSLNDTFTRHLAYSPRLGGHPGAFSTQLLLHVSTFTQLPCGLPRCCYNIMAAPLSSGVFTVRTTWDRCVDLSLPSFHILFLCQRAVLEEVEQDLYLLLVASWYTPCNGISRPSLTLSLLPLLSLPPLPTPTNFTVVLTPTWQKELKWADLLYKSLSLTRYNFLFV